MHAADSWVGHMIPKQIARFVGPQRTWTVPSSPPPDDTDGDRDRSGERRRYCFGDGAVVLDDVGVCQRVCA
jgi:hypothetical protein